MSERQQPHARYRRGLRSSVINNSSAFGFSVMITTTFGMMQHFKGSPTVSQIILFGVGAVLAFSIIEGAASNGFRRRPHTHPEEVIMLGTAANVLSVVIALGVAYAVGALFPEMVAWSIGVLLAAATYVLVEAAELAVAEKIEARIFSEQEAESPE